MFVLVRPFQPSQLFVSKARAYLHLGAPLKGGLLALPTRVKVNGSGKHSSLLPYGNNYGCKMFIVHAPGPRLIKLFTAIIYEFS